MYLAGSYFNRQVVERKPLDFRFCKCLRRIGLRVFYSAVSTYRQGLLLEKSKNKWGEVFKNFSPTSRGTRPSLPHWEAPGGGRLNVDSSCTQASVVVVDLVDNSWQRGQFTVARP